MRTKFDFRSYLISKIKTSKNKTCQSFGSLIPLKKHNIETQTLIVTFSGTLVQGVVLQLLLARESSQLCCNATPGWLWALLQHIYYMGCDDYYEKTTESPAYIMAMSKWLCFGVMTMLQLFPKVWAPNSRFQAIGLRFNSVWPLKPFFYSHTKK
jgi:hypothetical protein